MKNLIQFVLVFTFALGAIFTTATSSYAVALTGKQDFYRDSVLETKKYKNCTVENVDRISPDSDKALVFFTDDQGNTQTALVDWRGSLRKKLQRAQQNQTLVDISVNSHGDITGVR